MSYVEPGTAWNLLNDCLNRNGSICVQTVIVYPNVRSLFYILPTVSFLIVRQVLQTHYHWPLHIQADL